MIFLVLLMISQMEVGDGANVLCIAPFPALSHYQMVEPIMVALAQRGHKVTVLSHFPQNKKISNLTDIDLRQISSSYQVDFAPWNFIEDMYELFAFGREQCEAFAMSDKIQKFLETREKFDLIFLEAFDSDCCLGFVEKFKAPFVLFSAMALPVWESDWIYNPTEPSYVPDNLCRLAGKMNIYEKLQNTFCHLFFRSLYWFKNVKPSLEIGRKFFHAEIDTFENIKRNVSLILVNSFHGITGVRPFLPNVLEIGGIHIKPPKPLPQNIDLFLRESQDGVIVISMGSIVKSHTLNPEVRNGFLSVISRLKQKVLWKWEADLPNKPANLMTVPWLPQSDVLGHENVELFISHGGIHGVYEAVFHGVPVIGIPLFGDQLTNLKELEIKGAAVVIDFMDLNEKTLSSAIKKVLSNESYKANAVRLAKIFRDQPQTPLEKAIFWTEYAIRHRGAPHFQTGALKLSWIQYALIDVLFVCFSFCILLIVVFHYSLKFLRII